MPVVQNDITAQLMACMHDMTQSFQQSLQQQNQRIEMLAGTVNHMRYGPAQSASPAPVPDSDSVKKQVGFTFGKPFEEQSSQ